MTLTIVGVAPSPKAIKAYAKSLGNVNFRKNLTPRRIDKMGVSIRTIPELTTCLTAHAAEHSGKCQDVMMSWRLSIFKDTVGRSLKNLGKGETTGGSNTIRKACSLPPSRWRKLTLWRSLA